MFCRTGWCALLSQNVGWCPQLLVLARETLERASGSVNPLIQQLRRLGPAPLRPPDIVGSFDEENFTVMSLLDYSNAFDTLNNKLLSIRNIGLGRMQCVSVNGGVSSLLPIVRGVRQGALLGRLTYSIYICHFVAVC